MAEGISYNTAFVAKSAPDDLVQWFAQGLAGAVGVTVTMAGNRTLIVTRRYTPTWAIVVGVIGLLFLLVGVLAFFVKNTETLTIAISPEGTGSRISISGVAGPEIAARLNGMVGQLHAQ